MRTCDQVYVAGEYVPSYIEYWRKETTAPMGMATLESVPRMADMVVVYRSVNQDVL